jgi:hypothetical protein
MASNFVDVPENIGQHLRRLLGGINLVYRFAAVKTQQ